MHEVRTPQKKNHILVHLGYELCKRWTHVRCDQQLYRQSLLYFIKTLVLYVLYNFGQLWTKYNYQQNFKNICTQLTNKINRASNSLELATHGAKRKLIQWQQSHFHSELLLVTHGAGVVLQFWIWNASKPGAIQKTYKFQNFPNTLTRVY